MKSTVRFHQVIFLLALAALARPAFATISYTSCSSGCGSTTGTYAIWETAPGSAGLTFSMSPATFAGGNLVSGVYSDPTGTVLTGYNGASIDSLMSISGTSLLQGVGGTGTGIEITLPANTYAFAMQITTPSGSGFTNPWVAVGDHNVGGTNYNIIIPSGGNVVFFGIISDTPLTQLFVGPLSGGSRLEISDFELGESSPIPEASSGTLIGGGLVLFGILRRRIHKPDSAFA
ncbi:MAG: hypothetical protein ABI833_18515 [Acidobacteriota bacterium]